MKETNSKPVNVFVSYAHYDERHRQKLHKAISPLRRRNLINEWYDAGIVGGDEVDQEILRQLAKADLIVLLLSPSYVDSDYCWNKEMPAALRLRQQGNARVVGIVVEPVRLEGLELSRHKLLPKNMKPIPHWHPQSEGWNDVCKGLEQVIDDLNHPSPVEDALGVPKSILTNASESQGSSAYDPGGGARSIESVADFWDRRGSTVTPGSLVNLRGTFSQFAPMLMGPPRAKARLHKAFREALETNAALMKRKAASIDACMSVSAGQMVWRLRDVRSDYVYLGLYDSIVRNSIPVLVAKEYYESNLEAVFKAHEIKTFEASVTGRVIEMDNSPTKRFIERHAQDFISPRITDELCNSVYGLVVEGGHTSVERRGPARFLDGDTWIAVETEGLEKFLTAFLNVASPTERKEEINLLYEKAQRLPGPPRIMAQYDDDHEFAPEFGAFDTKNQFLDSIWRFGFGGTLSPPP